MAVKYKQFFKNMVSDNQDLFDGFKDISKKFLEKPGKYKDKFDKIGSEVLEIVNKTENKLCMQSEKTQYAKFSQKLSDKFWSEVRKDYPQIDKVDNTKYASKKPSLDDVLDDLF